MALILAKPNALQHCLLICARGRDRASTGLTSISRMSGCPRPAASCAAGYGRIVFEPGVTRVESDAVALHAPAAAGANKSNLPGTGVLPIGRRPGSIGATESAVTWPDCEPEARTGQNVPATASFWTSGSRVTVIESREAGADVDSTDARSCCQTLETRDRAGAEASAPTVLSATAMIVAAKTRLSIGLAVGGDLDPLIKRTNLAHRWRGERVV